MKRIRVKVKEDKHGKKNKEKGMVFKKKKVKQLKSKHPPFFFSLFLLP
jgi:hypothetical protein